MKKIEEFFYKLRCASKNDSRNKDWAKNDASNYSIRFHEIYPDKTIDEAFQYLNEFKNKQDKDISISKLNTLIKSHFSQLQQDIYKLNSPYKRSKQILSEWLKHWDENDIKRILSFTYKRYGWKLKQDSSAILEIIQELFIRLHRYEQESLNLGLFYRTLTNKDFHKKEPELKEYFLAEGLYYIITEPNIYSVDDFYKLILQKYNLSKNDKIIMDIAFELCKADMAGNTPKIKLKNFKRLFKERLNAIGLTGNTLNQAIKRLRDKVSDVPEDVSDYETPMGMLMGFMTEEDEPTPQQENQIKALEFLLELVEKK